MNFLCIICPKLLRGGSRMQYQQFIYLNILLNDVYKGYSDQTFVITFDYLVKMVSYGSLYFKNTPLMCSYLFLSTSDTFLSAIILDLIIVLFLAFCSTGSFYITLNILLFFPTHKLHIFFQYSTFIRKSACFTLSLNFLFLLFFIYILVKK